MAQMNVTVLNDLNTQSIPMYNGVDPTWTGVYFHALTDVPGVATANNYLSVLNPVGSGKIAIALGFICGSYSVNTVTTPAAMTAFRISTHSAGTDITAAQVNRFATAFANPVSQVKVGNPTVTTTSLGMIGIPPTVGTNAQNGQTVSPTPGASFIFQPGEGIVFQTATSDVDIRWQMQYIWAEKSM